MAKLTIDGKEFEFEGKPMILQVALENDVEIPHYCYHPGLSIVASCRICLAEVAQPNPRNDNKVEFIPKLMPTCQTMAMDGMEVHTQSPKSIANQKAVMEYLRPQVAMVPAWHNPHQSDLHRALLLRTARLLKEDLSSADEALRPLGSRMSSTIRTTSSGGGLVNFDTVIATAKFNSIPIVPIPSGLMPRNHDSAPAVGLMNLK